MYLGNPREAYIKNERVDKGCLAIFRNMPNMDLIADYDPKQPCRVVGDLQASSTDQPSMVASGADT